MGFLAPADSDVGTDERGNRQKVDADVSDRNGLTQHRGQTTFCRRPDRAGFKDPAEAQDEDGRGDGQQGRGRDEWAAETRREPGVHDGFMPPSNVPRAAFEKGLKSTMLG